MRPRPSRKHFWPVVVIVAVTAANTALTFRQDDITDDQANMLTEVRKGSDPTLYPSDEIFSSSGPGALWRMRLPAWQAILRAAGALGGERDPLNALRIVGAAALLVYLLSMYVLLYRQTHNTSIAVLVAAMSMCIFSVRRPYWGLGPIFSVTPATLCIAFVPLLALGFVRLRRRWSVLGVFFLAGLCGNIGPTIPASLVLVMLIALLALGRFSGRSCALAVLAAVAAAGGAAPAVYHYYVTFRAAVAAFLPAMPLWQLREILDLAGANVLYPEVLIQLLRWLPVAVLLAVPPVLILSRTGRYRVHDLGAWLWLLLGALAVAFGFHGLVQVLAWRLGALPPVIEFFEALRLAMLPLYVLFAQAAVHLIRVARVNRPWVRGGLAVLAAVYIGASFNTRTLRHMVSSAVATLGEAERPGSAGLTKGEELRAIARWAGDPAHTDRGALFVCPYAEMRLHGRRSILCCPSDVWYLYHMAPGRLASWKERLEVQKPLLTSPGPSPADIDRVIDTARRHWRRRASPAGDTYVLIPSSAKPNGLARLREVSPPGESWGRHWRVFQLLPRPPATTTSPTTATAPATATAPS